MSGSPDSSNLMYVTKAYEEEVKNKAKAIYANDEVHLTMENVNKQLDDIVTEIDKKLTFVKNKIDGEYGVDAYVQGVHTQIDKVNIDQESLVSDNVKNTKTHPSVMAFKSNRQSTKFNTYDFINKSIEFDNKSPNLALTGSKNIDSSEEMLTFNFNTSSKEYLKIIEFSLTYKQYPDIINKNLDDSISVETTVTVTRIISGRFFLIRHDPVAHPDQFIIKAIITNSDNTGNVIDRKLIDVQSYKETKDFSYIFDDGPQFDLYFKFDDNATDGLKIFFGKIVPYRYVIRKTYINTNDGTMDTNFKKSDMTSGASDGIGTHNIEDIYHSSNLSCSFIVDKTRNEISIVNDGNKFDNRYLSSNNDINHISGSKIDKFWVKDVLGITFIRLKDIEHDTCFVGINNVNMLVDIGRPIDDVIGLTTNEILVKINNTYYYYDLIENTISQNYVFLLANTDTNFGQKTLLLEYQDKYLIQFYTKPNGLCYRFKELDSGTKTYSANLNISPEHDLDSFPTSKIELLNPNDSEIFGFADTTGIYIGLNYINESSDKESFIIHCSELTVSGISYLFKKSTILDVFNKNTGYTSTLTNKISKMINTRLFNFLITDNHELFIFDEKRIVKAISFEEVPDLGWSDKNSVLYMEPEENQDEYYLVNNAYLNDVQDVIDTPNGVIIIDKKGVYSVEENKNIKCRLFLDNESELLKYLPSFDKYNRTGLVVTVNDPNETILKYTMFKNEYTLKEYKGNKVRYDYLDLFTSDYQLYDETITEYDENIPIIDFHSILYISFVDHLSTIYNSTGNVNISITYTPYSQISSPNFDGKKYCVSTNKYGFVKYDNILSLDTSKSRISDINAIKKLKILHKKGDPFTYADSINTIHDIVKAEYAKYKNDMIQVKGTKVYDSDWHRNPVLSTTTIDNNFTDNIFEDYIDTKYGRYGIVEKENKKYLGWLSNTALKATTQPDSSLFKIFDFYQGSFEFDDSTARNFKFIALDDEFGTCFVSNGQKTLMCKARDENHCYMLPFSKNPSESGNEYFNAEIVRNEDDQTLMITNIIQAKDKEIIGWVNTFGNNSLYFYNPMSGKFETREGFEDVFGGEVQNTNYAKIINVIKIGNNYHIIGMVEHTGSDSTTTELVYVIRGEKSIKIQTSDALIPSLFTQFGDSTTTVDFYDFESIPVAVIKNKPFVYVSKYDKGKDQFVCSLHQIENSDIDNQPLLKFIEINENGNNVIYGFSYPTETQDMSITRKFYPFMFKYDYKNDHIDQLIGTLYHNSISGYKSIDLKDNKDSKCIECYLLSDIKKTMVKYFYHNASDAYVNSRNFDETNSPYGISKPVEVIYDQGTVDERRVNKLYSLAAHTVDGVENLYLTEFKNNNVPRESYKLGHNNKLSSKISMPHLTSDSSPDVLNIKTYYKIDPSKTTFNKYYENSFPATSHKNLVKIFERVIKSQTSYIQIDRHYIKEPTPGINYYKLTLNGTYELQSNLKTFISNNNYYIQDSDFRLVEVDPSSGQYELFNASNLSDGQSRYFTSINPYFVECTENDFNIVANSQNTGNDITFKDDISYYELNEETVVVNLTKENTAIIDNKLFVFGTTAETINSSIQLNDAVFVYELTDSDLFIDRENSHNLLNHALSETFFDIIDTKICKLALKVKNDNNVTLFRVSDDLSFVREEYSDISIPVNWYNQKNIDSRVSFEISETSHNVFVSYSYPINEASIHRTYIINDENLSCKIENENMDRTIRFITEFEDGSIYGYLKDDSDPTKLNFVKFGVNGTNSFSNLQNSDETLEFVANGFVILKTAKRITDTGKTELLIFGKIGIDGNNKYSVYRLYENRLEPFEDNILQSLILDDKFVVVDNEFVDYYRGIMYDFDTKQISYVPISNVVSPQVNKYDPLFISTEDFPDFDSNIIIFDKNYSLERIPIPLPILEEKTLSFDPFAEIENSETILSLYDHHYTDDNTDGPEFTNTISMVKQLPVISKDDEIYYTIAKADTNNLLPNYEKRYDAYDTTGSTIKHLNCTFDRLYETSIGIFGVLGKEIYLNEIYQNNNGFRYIRTLPTWSEVERKDVFPYVQECDGSIYITYKTVYKYNTINKDLTPILQFNNTDTINVIMKDNIDIYEKLDKYYSRLFITEFNEIYYFINVNSQSNVYKFNKETKEFELYYVMDGNPKVIRDLSIGVVVLTDTNKLENVTRCENMSLPQIENGSIQEFYDFIEIPENNYIIITYKGTDGFRYTSQYKNGEWTYGTKTPQYVNDINTFIKEEVVDNDDKVHTILLELKNNGSSQPEGYGINASTNNDGSTEFYLGYSYLNKNGELVYKNDLVFSKINYPISISVYPVKTKDSSIELMLHDLVYGVVKRITFDYNKETDEIYTKVEKLDFKTHKTIKGVMRFSNIYILKNYDSLSLSGFNITSKIINDENVGYKQLGYSYSVIASNSKKWNNELKDISNTLKDKCLFNVFGICKDDEINEFFIDNNNDYHNDIKLVDAKKMDLVEFYKKYYLSDWENNLHNHLFKRKSNLMFDMYIGDSYMLENNDLFDDEQYEIELNIFGSPILTEEENKVETMRLSTSWYLKKLNKHVPHLPYYPFTDS